MSDNISILANYKVFSKIEVKVCYKSWSGASWVENKVKYWSIQLKSCEKTKYCELKLL